MLLNHVLFLHNLRYNNYLAKLNTKYCEYMYYKSSGLYYGITNMTVGNVFTAFVKVRCSFTLYCISDVAVFIRLPT